MLEDAPALIQKLTASNQTLSTVESCTGGLLFGYLTAVPGAGGYRPIGPSVANCAKKTDITLAFHMRQANTQWLGPALLCLHHDL